VAANKLPFQGFNIVQIIIRLLKLGFFQ